jgi:hypothetical protein
MLINGMLSKIFANSKDLDFAHIAEYSGSPECICQMENLISFMLPSHSGICPQGALLVPYKCLTTNLSIILSTSQAYTLRH